LETFFELLRLTRKRLAADYAAEASAYLAHSFMEGTPWPKRAGNDSEYRAGRAASARRLNPVSRAFRVAA